MRSPFYLQEASFRLPILFAICIVICLITQQSGSGAPPKDALVLDATELQLLEEIKKGTTRASTKLKSGTIAFTLTLSEPTRPLRPGREIEYEAKGHWDITYDFDGEQQFYDVKARTKSEFNGVRFSDWQQMRHQYLVDGETLYVWEKTGAAWNAHPPRKISSGLLEERYNPLWWSWPPWRIKLSKMLAIWKPTEVKQINTDGNHVYHLAIASAGRDAEKSLEFWLNPQKDYLPTRFLVHQTYTQPVWEGVPEGSRSAPPKPTRFDVRRDLTRYTYQIAHFDHDIWFPKSVTQERLTLDKNGQPRPVKRKVVMRVHRAVFNVPVEERERHVTPVQSFLQ